MQSSIQEFYQHGTLDVRIAQAYTTYKGSQDILSVIEPIYQEVTAEALVKFQPVISMQSNASRGGKSLNGQAITNFFNIYLAEKSVRCAVHAWVSQALTLRGFPLPSSGDGDNAYLIAYHIHALAETALIDAMEAYTRIPAHRLTLKRRDEYVEQVVTMLDQLHSLN